MPRQIHPTPFVIQPPDTFMEKHPELPRLSQVISMKFAGGLQKQAGLTEIVTEEHLQAMGISLWQSLAIRQGIGDKAGEGTTLNNIALAYRKQGDNETALTYYKQSLAIRQQIGNKAGLCATLFNMGHIHMQNKQMQEAMNAWVTVYVIAKQINEFQALQALSKLAPQVGLPEGLEGWEQLAQKLKDGGTGEGKSKDERFA